MPTTFPAALDNFANPEPTTLENAPGFEHHLQHGNANDAIEALEAKVGVDNSTVPGTLDYQVRALQSGKADTGHTHPPDHTHANKPALDKVGESGGEPSWNGGPWPSSPGTGDMTRAVYDPNLDGKVASADTADAVPWSGVSGKPATFAPSAHVHAISDLPVATSGESSATKVVQADDARLSNARTPTAHSHLIGDLPVAASGVSSAIQLVRADDSRLADARTPVGHSHALADLPVATSGESSATKLVRSDDARLSDARTPTSHSHGIADLPVADSGESSATELVRADDSRLSDARTPTSHGHTLADLPVASSGESSATKVVRADDSRLSNARTPVSHSHALADLPVAAGGEAHSAKLVRSDDPRVTGEAGVFETVAEARAATITVKLIAVVRDIYQTSGFFYRVTGSTAADNGHEVIVDAAGARFHRFRPT